LLIPYPSVPRAQSWHLNSGRPTPVNAWWSSFDLAVSLLSGRLAARWDAALGEYIVDWDDVRTDQNPAAVSLEFARCAFRHACLVCGWDAELGR
jgi:hypothetical protein